MGSFDFGPYRTTPDTVERPHRTRFRPEYKLSAAVFQKLRSIERADQQLGITTMDAYKIRRVLSDAMARNAYGTASIEGNPLSLDEVENLLERGPTPDALVHPDEREIINYAAVIQEIETYPIPRTVDDVCRLHARLFDGVLEDAGRFKKAPNFIGKRPEYEVVFVPTRPEHVHIELRNALDWVHEADEHPLIRIAVFFHEFQSIHPFRDGNGRCGRALSTLLLHHFGYPGVRFALVDYEFNEDRDSYYQSLAQVERTGFDYTNWIAYFTEVLNRTFEGALDRLLFNQELPSTLNDRQVHLAQWFARLNREHPHRRVKFNDIHAAFPLVAERTLKRDLARLRTTGVLEMEGERKASRYRMHQRNRDDHQRS